MSSLNDVATCLSKIVHEFNNDLTQRLQVVSALSRLLGRFEALEYGDYDKQESMHEKITEYCKNNFDKIVNVIPDLKDAVTDYLIENPWFEQSTYDYCHEFMEYEEIQQANFIIALKSQFKI